ncbi:unnamed protein product [Calicophoron daubneyi]|uniref:RING-type E3 ubiquitin transferase n=1 Tax=Calicophoron daubneyi TaxID=300641 RepID=A0AAV2T490_CALDB
MASEGGDQGDFCRVCRCEGTRLRPLFHPCMCTGSIKYIHQDCLLKWLQYSRRHACELCNHRFKFAPIYASGTPRFVPIKVLLVGLINSLRRSVLNWLHLLMVFLAWLIVVPLTACRIYRCLFTGSVSSLLTLPLDMLSSRHLLQDCLQGFTIVILALAAFLGYMSLREQLLQGGGPAWLEQAVAPGNEADDEPNGRRQFFPDLFNLFGAANGVDGGPPAEGANANVPVLNVPPAYVPETNTPESGASNLPGASQVLPSASEAEQASTSHAAPLTSENQEPTPEQSDALPMQPQQFGWRTTGMGPEDWGPGAGEDGVDEPEGDVGGEAAGLGEAMNWDRLLGLDGSLAFLEHVLWLIALNTLFIVIFAFCPYHMGQFTVMGFRMGKLVAATHMEGLSTSLIGYLIVAGALVLLHTVFMLAGMPRACYWAGLGYVYIKVALVSLLELGIFPVLCGFWIDACTLSLFNSTIASRASVFHYAPMAFTFIHWAMGMLYIFYMASLLVLGRSVVRPGVLRFVYHFNDPDYKPIQDMIMQPLHIYIQRLIATYSIWGILIVLMLWVPIEVVRRLIPGFLPFQITVAHESPLDYSVEIILVQVVLPFLLDVQAKATMRQLLRLWCVSVSWLLGIRSYLLGDIPFESGDYIILEDGREVPFDTQHGQENTAGQPSAQPTPSGSGEAYVNHDTHPTPSTSSGQPETAATTEEQDHEEGARNQPDPDEDAEGFAHYVPYKRTSLFGLRITGFMLTSLFSLMVMSLICLVVPVGIGRFVFSLISSKATPKHDAVALVSGFTILGLFIRVASCFPLVFSGLRRTLSSLVAQSSRLVCWSRPLRVLRIWTRSGTTCEISIPRPALPPPIVSLRTGQVHQIDLLLRLRGVVSFCGRLLRLSSVAILLLVILPVAVGLLINLVFITPFQVGPRKTLVIGFWEHWIFGIMHLKVAILLILVGPPWWFHRRLDAVQNEIVQHRFNARAFRILSELAPLIVGVGMFLAVPYLLAKYFGPSLGFEVEYAVRYVYISLLLVFLVIVLGILQIKQFQNLYIRIKNEKYLIGKRLVNFRPEPRGCHSVSAVSQETTDVSS